MATKMKEGIPTKEKRGASPSHPPNKDTIQRGKSPRPSISKQAPPANRSNSASPSGRNVPNYLKGTASSGPESSLDHGKKHSPNETLIKPTISISRRRSLDKPLPPSSIPKTRVSTITRETKKQPSSPSSARATPSAKPLSGRLSKVRSFGEEKASRNHVKKLENEARGLSTKDTITEIVDINHAHDIAPKNENALQTPQIESMVENKDDLDASIVEKEEDLDAAYITQINKDTKDKDDIKKEMIVLEDNNTNIDIDSEIEVEEVKMDESSIASKDKNESFDSTEENLNENEIPNEEQGELEPHISDMEESTPNQVEANASEEKEVEERKTELPTNQELKEKEEEGEGSHDIETKESETVKVEVKKEKQGGEKSVAVKQQVVQGKRDSVVSNDVIEETATKLREQRINRVKALAGAFESVISFQETK